jgi:hypothetical protein
MSGSIDILDDGPLERVGRFARERLELAFTPKLFTHRWMPSRITPQIWGELLNRTPFVGLGWAQLGPKPATPLNMFVGYAAWSAYLVARNPNGQEARLFGDKQGPGLLKMTRAAIAVLHGAKVPGVGTIEVTSTGHATMEGYEKDDVSLASVDFHCQIGITLANTLSGIHAPSLSEIDSTWSFQGSDGATLSDTNQTGAS